MTFDIKMWINIIIAILFSGFFVLSVLSVRTIIKQRTIIISSLISRQSGLIEVLDVNIALIVIVILVQQRIYIYIPVVTLFAFFIMTTTRLKSGICDDGIFIGMTFVSWKHIKAYKLTNDDINTIQIKFRANNRQYVMRCNKKYVKEIVAMLKANGIKEQQTIQNTL